MKTIPKIANKNTKMHNKKNFQKFGKCNSFTLGTTCCNITSARYKSQYFFTDDNSSIFLTGSSIADLDGGGILYQLGCTPCYTHNRLHLL